MLEENLKRDTCLIFANQKYFTSQVDFDSTTSQCIPWCLKPVSITHFIKINIYINPSFLSHTTSKYSHDPNKSDAMLINPVPLNSKSGSDGSEIGPGERHKKLVEPGDLFFKAISLI